MKNVITQRCVLGMLMMCVMVLGVVGVADALTFSTSRSGDLVTVAPNQTFTLRFSVVGLRSPQAVQPNTRRASTTDIEYADSSNTARVRPTADPDPITGSFTRIVDTGYTDGDTHYYTRTTTSSVRNTAGTADVTRTLHTRNWVTESEAYYYNDESVSITTSPAVTLMKGSTAVTSLVERHAERDQQLSSSVTLTGSHGTAAAYDITITDTTDAADIDGTPPSSRASIIFTVFVVDSRAATPSSPTLSLVTDQNYAIDGDDFVDQQIAIPGSGNIRIEYSVVEGPGRLYVQIGTSPNIRKSSPLRTLSTSDVASVRLDMNGGTNKVQATAAGAPPTTGVFIFGYPSVEIVSGNNQEGALGGRLEDPLVVRVTDGKNRAISGLAAAFTSPGDGVFFPVPGTTVYTSDVAGTTLAGAFTANPVTATSTRPGSGAAIAVQTNSSGQASTYFQLAGTGASQTVTVAAGGSNLLSPFRFTERTGTAANAGIPSIEIESGNNQRSVNGNIEDPLVVVVRRRGQRAAGVQVTFTTDRGVLDDTPIDGFTVNNVTDDNDNPSTSLDDMTDGQGRASVRYSLGDFTGSIQVVASISGTDPVTYRREVTFGINGGRSTVTTNNQQQQQQQQQQQSTTPSLTLSSTTISGAAGSTQTITATVRRGTSAAPGIGVTFQVGSLTPVTVTANSNGQASHTFTLPSASTTLSVSANVLGTVVSGSVQLTVSGTTGTGAQTGTTTETGGTPSRLIIDGDADIDGERNSSEELVVRVVDRNGDGVTGVPVRFRTTEGSGRFSPSLARTDNSGYADVRFTPTYDGDIEIQVSSGTLDPVYFTITTGEPPHALKKISGDNQSGRTGERLANPFIVEVVDENDDPVSGATVTFSVTGGGSLSTERVTTNGTGRAQTTLRLGDTPGNQTVTARVAGVSEGVAFTARAGAQILVDASQRAPLYWVNTQQGTLHRLVSDAVENLASRTRGITSLVVDTTNGILYFGVNLDGKRGEIRRSGLTGRNVQSVKTGINVPVDIALDATGETLYWATANGKVKSQPTEGSTRGTNILDNLADPRGIVVSDGFLYWSESLGRLRRLNLTDPEANVETLVTGLGEPLSLAIGRGKMYWTEQGARGGLLQRANLDGSNVEELKPFTGGVPTGLAIDVDDRKLYWTRPQGKIERSNLMGRSVRDIVTGLVSPGAIALAGPVPDAEPVAERPTRTTTTTDSTDTTKTAADSKYDLNGDGKVNSKDVDAILLAVLAGLDLAKYDVNGDGSVDVEDIKAVNDAAIGDAAAPTINVDVSGLDLDPDRLQEQIDLLIASGDTSLAAQRVLAYFQHLLASLRPDETVLLANYPNPFNPETWIPYHLATSTDVQVNIYNAQGVLVRALTLGHQTAGYYTSRSRAAYWDGRNALGERVASGIYFYQLQTDEVSPMRKMVILK